MLILEGFERVTAIQVPGGPMQSDLWGWTRQPGNANSTINPVGPPKVRIEGQALNFASTAADSTVWAFAHFNPGIGTSWNKLTIGFAINFYAKTGGSRFFELSDQFPTPHSIGSGLGFQINSSANTIEFWCLATPAITVASLELGKWVYLELTVNKATSTFDVSVNGTPVSTGITHWSLASYLSTWPGYAVFGRSPTGYNYSIDDFYFHADTGGDSGNPLGAIHVRTHYPDSAYQAQFTPVGAASNLEAISDNDEATYVTTSGAAKDIYDIDASTDDDIVAVQSSAVAKTDAGTATLSVGVNSAATQQTVNTAWAAKHHISTTNPATGLPWAPADLATLKSGYAYGSW